MPTLLDQLLDWGILDPGALPDEVRSKLGRDASANPEDLKEVLDLVCERGLLTEFQRREIETGRGSQLRIGDYLKLDCLGQGGMGAVYRARRQGSREVVAIKTLTPALQSDPSGLRRLRRELQAAAELVHPNIVRTYTLNETPQGPVLVMEYAEGINLHKLVQRDGTLTPDRVLDYLRQAAQGLEHAHRCGVIHRDVKPSNLLVGEDGRIRVLDFGVARVAQPPTDGDATTLSELTQSGAVLGTVDFMAPEQAFDSKSVDGRADIYSLGCTLYYLLHGAPPFHGETAVETLLAHNESEIPSLAIRGSRRMRLGLEAIFGKMLAKKPADRFQSMGELVDAWDQLAASVAAARRLARHTVTGMLLGLAACGMLLVGAIARGHVIAPAQVADENWAAVASRSKTSRPVLSGWSTLEWEAGPEGNGILGLIPRPANLPGLAAWQLETRQPRINITTVAFSRDARRLYYGTFAGQLWAYDLVDRKVLGICAAHAGQVYAIAVHPSGGSVATVGEGESSVRLWSRDLQPGPAIPGHSGGAIAVAWSPEGKTLATGGHDRMVRLWNEQGQPGRVLRGHEGAVRTITWHPAGTKLASAGADKAIRLWNANGTPDKVLTVRDGEVGTIAWHPGGEQLLSGGADKQLRVWDLASGTARTLDEPKFAFKQVGWSPDGNSLASLTSWPDSKLVLRDTAATLRQYSPADSRLELSWLRSALSAAGATRPSSTVPGVSAFAWHPGNHLVAAGGLSSAVKLVGQDGRLYLEINSPYRFGGIRGLNWRPDGQRFATCDLDGAVRIWERDGRLHKTMTGHQSSVDSVRWSADGGKLATGSHDRTVRVWDQDGNLLHTFEGHQGLVATYSLAWSPDGRWVASASTDRTVRLWNLQGEKPRVFNEHRGPVQSVDWSSDGSALASIDDQGVILVWGLDGERHAEAKSAGGGIGVVSWSADGQTLASIGRGGQVQLWDRSGKLLRESRIDGNMLQWSPVGDRLLVGGDQGATIWNLRDDTSQVILKHYRRFHAFGWHPTEDLVLTSGPEGAICAWDPTTGETRWVSIVLEGDEFATFGPAGKLLAGSPRAVERNLVALTRDDQGRTETRSVSEFFQRFGINIYE